MSARAPLLLVAAAACGLLALPASAVPAHRSLSIGSIKAEFSEATRSTRYTLPDLKPDPGTTVTEQWTLTLTDVDPDKPVDSGCNNRGVLSGTGPEFVWHHANKGDPIGPTDNCDHSVFGKYGHQGLITVVVTDNLGARCTATYKGTNSSDANSVANAVASPESCTAAPSTGGVGAEAVARRRRSPSSRAR